VASSTVCESYAREFDIIFNGPKSQYLIFRGKDCNPLNCCVTVNNESLYNITSAVHLGHSVHTEDSDSMVSAALASFWKSFNIFMADLGMLCSSLKSKFFNVYCCSYYGSPLWPFSSHKKVAVAWRKALRHIWNVPPMTHCNLIAVLSESPSLEVCLMKRFCKFAASIFDKGSDLVNGVATIALSNPFSTFCYNVCEVSGKCNGPLYDFTGDVFKCFSHKLCNDWNDNVDNLSGTISILKEMIDVRDGFKVCDTLTIEEVKVIIEDVCVN
jgi:hypothetical protein